MRGCLCKICNREVGNLRNVCQRDLGHSHKNTLCVSSSCVGQVRGGKGTSNKRASRRGAPEASYDRRRHPNCFPTRPAQAFPKK